MGQRHVALGRADVAASAAACAVDQQGQHADDADSRGDVIGIDCEGVAIAFVIARIAPLGCQAGCGAHQRAVTHPRAPRSGIPECGTFDHDQVGLDPAQIVKPQTERGHGAGLEIGQHHIGPGNHSLEDCLAFGRAQVEAKAALVAVPGGQADGHAGCHICLAGAIGEGTRFQFDHFRAIIRQQAARFPADHDHSQVQHVQPVERAMQHRIAGCGQGHVGRRSGASHARVVDLHDPVRQGDYGRVSDLKIGENSTLRNMFGPHGFVEFDQSGQRHAVLRCARFQFGAGLVGKEPGDERVQFRGLQSHADAIHLWGGELLRTAQPFKHPAPLPRRTDVDSYQPILAAKDRILDAFGRAVGREQSRGLAHRGAAVDAVTWIERLHRSVERGKIDPVGPPGALAVIDRQQDEIG